VGPVKSPLAALFVALSIATVAASAAPASPPKLTKWQQQQLEKFKNSAPADEYFGKMKMSFLGMNNTFRDSAISSGDHTTDPAIINKVALAEDALEAWARKYPRDPQLARTYYLATLVDRKIWVKGNQDRAWIFLNRLVNNFPDTYFGKILKRDLAIGFTQHYYASPVPCTTPVPVAEATDAAVVNADSSAAPSDAPSPTPTLTPTPGPIETTLQKGLRVQIIPQACVPPPTPTPSPSPTPSPTASPTPELAPPPPPPSLAPASPSPSLAPSPGAS
jgi:hypothetical protein